MRLTAATLLACLLPLSALATDFKLDTSGDFRAQRAAIAQQIGEGGKLVEMTRADRAELTDAMARIEASLGEHESISSLSGQPRADVDRDVERLNTLISTAAADSRVVCRRVKVLGSNRSQNSCQTVAERRRQHEGVRDQFEQGYLPGSRAL